MEKTQGKFQFFTFESEQEALDFKRKNRWRKGTISYSTYWNCWLLTRTLK